MNANLQSTIGQNNRQNNNDDPTEQQRLLTALEDVCAIDKDRAINAMSGQVRLFLKLINSFTHEQQQRCTELNYLFTQGDWSTLSARAHSLKTYSAYVGAFELSKHAALLETQSSEQNVDKALLDTVCQHLDALLSELNPIYKLNPNKYDHFPVHYNHAEFSKLLKTCIPLLNQGNAAVDDVLPKLYQMCQGTQYEENIETLIAYVDDIEFELAAQTAEKVLDHVVTA